MHSTLKPKDWLAIEEELKALPIKKHWKINLNDNKPKVVRKNATTYTVIHNGHFVHEATDWADAFETVKALLATH
jgi:hypothetical protein